jgi:hypothetical protein
MTMKTEELACTQHVQDMKLRLELIDQSILKWKAIVFHGGADKGSGNCPLCQKYNQYRPLSIRRGNCMDCPIKYWGASGCANDEYDAWREYIEDQEWEEGKPTDIVMDAYSLKLANRELSFLHEVRLWWLTTHVVGTDYMDD